MRSRSFIFWVLLLVDVSPSGYVKTNEEENMPQIEKYSDMNVFVAVGDGVKTLIVMEGDSVTLNTSVTEIKREDTILWMFKNEYIVKINEATGLYFISEGEGFRDRLALDKQTGSLTIKNIRTGHTGHYQLQILSNIETTKKFNVTVRDAKWKNAIKLNDHTGDLTIRNIQIQHSGDYDLEINNSTTILHMKFNIAVSDLPKSSDWNTFGPVLVAVLVTVTVLLIVFAFVIWLMIKMDKIKVSWCHKNGGNQRTPRTPTSIQPCQANDGVTEPLNDCSN